MQLTFCEFSIAHLPQKIKKKREEENLKRKTEWIPKAMDQLLVVQSIEW